MLCSGVPFAAAAMAPSRDFGGPRVRDALVLLLTAVLLLGSIGCSGGPPPPEPEVPVVPVKLAVDVDIAALAGRWRRAAGEAGVPAIDTVETDAALALTSLIEGKVEGAIVLRKATPAEDRYAAGDDLVPREGLVYELIARLPVVFLIHESNFVDVMSVLELQRVLGGGLREWDSLGGSSTEIALYGRPQGTSTAAQVTALLGGGRPANELKALPTDKAVATAVRADPSGLGVGGGAPALGTKALAVKDGEALLMPGTSTGSPWPWVRDVYIVTQGPPSRRVREVRDFARSDGGRRIAEQEGFFGWVEGWQ